MACRAMAHIISGTQDCLSNQYIKKQHMTTIYVVTPMMELYGDVSPAMHTHRHRSVRVLRIPLS